MQDYQPNQQPNNNNPINFNPEPTPGSVGQTGQVPVSGLGNNRQAEDIFATVDSVPQQSSPQQSPAVRPAPAPAQPLASISQNRPMPTPTAVKNELETDMLDQPAERGSFKYLIIGIATLLIVLVAGAFVYQIVLKPRFQAQTTDFESLEAEFNLLDDTYVEEPVDVDLESDVMVEEPVELEIVDPIILDQPLDSDGDGLSDAQEDELKTNKFAIDSDGDGLSDKEEVQIYNTNPLDPDTDGDTYLDGQEVQNGYNPNGAGKLFNPDLIN